MGCNRLVGALALCTSDEVQTALELEAVSAELAALRNDLADLLDGETPAMSIFSAV